MDLLSRIAGWLGENEATISAVVGIAVLTGIVLAGLRSVLPRRAEPDTEVDPEEDTLLALADQTGLVLFVPQFLLERANLARQRGEESKRLLHLGETHRLFVEMGATGNAEPVARELGL